MELTNLLISLLGLELEVEFTPAYPQELPKYSILTTSGKLNNQEDLNKCVLKEAEGSIGMAMVFSIVSSIEDWLAKNTKPAQSVIKSSSEPKPETTESPITMRGGPVTPATFLEWNTKFLAEIQLSKAQKDKKIVEIDGSKLTGRQLFEQNKSLINSDATFGDETDIVIDEGLFDGLDDLDVEAVDLEEFEALDIEKADPEGFIE